jgi:hypothetical protein
MHARAIKLLPNRYEQIACHYMPADLANYANRLYSELHRADAEGWDWIALVRPPASPEWSDVLDRRCRASTPD